MVKVLNGQMVKWSNGKTIRNYHKLLIIIYIYLLYIYYYELGYRNRTRSNDKI